MDNKKEKIFNAAREEFLANGFKKASMAKIAKKAGVASGTIYLYFSSKEELFQNVYVQENADTKEAVISAIDPDLPSPEFYRQLILGINEACAKNPILGEWYNPETMPILEQYYKKKDMPTMVESIIYSKFDKWHRENPEFPADRELVGALLRVFMLLETNKEYIGVDQVPRVLDLLLTSLLGEMERVSHQARKEDSPLL